MRNKRLTFLLIATGMSLITFGLAWLGTAQPAEAQCGSQASSCKNCHEVQGQDPVNNDGTGWHNGHAFGDFCYICHGGNNQAVEKNTSHAGMVPPLSDVNAACQQCHPKDLTARAQKYASVLGVEIGTGGSAPSPTAPSVVPPTPAALEPTELAAPGMVIEQPTIDYVQRYYETVLGKKPVNWGNVILITLIGIIVIGGGAYVLNKEGWVSVSFEGKKQGKGKYPADVIDMMPYITRLKPAARKALRHILEKPQAAAQYFTSFEKTTGAKPFKKKEYTNE